MQRRLLCHQRQAQPRTARAGRALECLEQMRARPLGYARACEALERVDLTGVIGKIKAPTLVVCGEDDAPPFTAASRALADTLPGAEIVWLSPARHAGVLEQPEQFQEALSRFLGDGEPT